MAKKSIQPKIKEPVRLRSKKLADGSESLYLDIYRDGRRSYEYLKLYIHPETGPQIKTLNSETMKAANTIKMERILEITHNEAGLKHTSSRAKMLLEAAFTAAAENTMQKAEALGLDSASLRAQCEKHGAAARRIQ